MNINAVLTIALVLGMALVAQNALADSNPYLNADCGESANHIQFDSDLNEDGMAEGQSFGGAVLDEYTE